MGRSPCCDENGLKKGPWTPEEDQKLVNYVQKHGHGSWRALPKLAGLNRCGKSCRLRWTNYLRPDIKRGKFSQEEEQTILHLHSILGNKWSAIASHLPGRTDNEIKNFWNTHLKKKLIQMGFDPMTHQPRTDDLLSSLTHLLALANLRNLMDHHSLMDDHAIQLAKLQYLEYLLQSAAPTGANSYTPNANITNMEAFTLSSLSSLSSTSIPDVKEKSVLSSLQITMENPPSFSLERETSQPLQYNPILALPDHLTAAPEVPFQNNDEMCQTSDPNSRYWVLPSPNYTAVNPPLVTDLSMNLQPEEGNSSNIYRGDQGPSPCWSELFETIY